MKPATYVCMYMHKFYNELADPKELRYATKQKQPYAHSLKFYLNSFRPTVRKLIVHTQHNCVR